MSSYTICGTMQGRPAKIEWKDGKLTGDRLLVDFVTTDAKLLEGQPVGPPTGPFTLTKHLSDPTSTLFLIRQHLDEAPNESSGDIPTLPWEDNRIY